MNDYYEPKLKEDRFKDIRNILKKKSTEIF